MNAMEKVAWAELLVCATAVAAVGLLVPWLGDGAMGGFGLLGFLGFTALFLRQRGNRVITDERDTQIQRTATGLSMGAAWFTLFMGVTALVIWANQERDVVPTRVLTWLIWISFAVLYGVKGLAGVVLYRRHHAA